MKVIIVGAEIGGLTLANGLRKANIDVQVFELQQEPTENLAGYGLHIDINGRRALRNCLPTEVWTEFMSQSISAGARLTFRDTCLNVLAERDDVKISGKPAAEVERRGISRIDLRNLLLQGLGSPDGCPVVKWGMKFDRYEQLKDGRVLVHFVDGSSIIGDLLVGADGTHSKVRGQHLPHIQREVLDAFVIAGRYVLDQKRLAAISPHLTDGSLNNIVSCGKGWMFVSAWYGGTERGVPSSENVAEHYVVWGLPMPKKDVGGVCSKLSVDDVHSLAIDCVNDWCPDLQTLVQDCDLSTLKAIPLRTMPELKHWEASNVTLIGDAIHSMTMMAGMGANTALRDASLLCETLVDVVHAEGRAADAVAPYETLMRGYANAAIAVSRRNSEGATSENMLSRLAFRTLLKMAQALPLVMRWTIGKRVA